MIPAPSLWVLTGTLGTLWVIVVHQLTAQWNAYPQYRYGWGVPLLSIYLLFERWKTRPKVQFNNSKRVVVFMVALCLVLFPTRLLHEANPIWRLTTWALTLEVLFLTFGSLWLVGGGQLA